MSEMGQEVPTGHRISDASIINRRKPSYTRPILENFVSNQSGGNLGVELRNYLESNLKTKVKKQ